MNRLMLALAVVDGLAIARIDSRPTWDDAGITAGMPFLSAGFFTLFAPRRPWLVAFMGAYSAIGIRKLADELKANH